MILDEYKYAYYHTLRREARAKVVEALNKRIKTPEHREIWRGITLASIDEEAVQYARREWPKYYGEETHLGFDISWERLYFKFMAIPSNFNLAIWQAYEDTKILQGLALGKPSRGKTHLTLNWIERSFAPTYFKGGILLPTLACAEEYAKLLGSQRVLIKDPVDPGAFGRYGYAPTDHPKGAEYLAKEVNHG